jgi:hypothetical protein
MQTSTAMDHKIGTDLKEKSQELDFQVLAIPFCDPPGKVLGIQGCYHMLLYVLISDKWKNWSTTE